jgi:hypothetical protein
VCHLVGVFFCFTETKCKSEAFIAPLDTAINGIGLHDLLGIIASTVATEILLNRTAALLAYFKHFRVCCLKDPIYLAFV